MRNSLQKRLSKEGWTGKQLSAFFEKHGVTRSWKTILGDINNARRYFKVNKIGGYVILPDNTVKKYIEYITKIKKIKKMDGTIVKEEELIRDINDATKEWLDEEKREEKNKEDVFGGEFVDPFGSIEDRIIALKGSIKIISRV